jgi:hypothetical protein
MTGLRAVVLLRAVVVAPLAALTTLGGCTGPQASPAAAVGGPKLEADPRPGQGPPASSLRGYADDRAEPFGPNDGRNDAPAAKARELRVPQNLAAEEAIIAAAITAHEMRRP